LPQVHADPAARLRLVQAMETQYMRPSKTLLAALLVLVAALPVCAKKERKNESAPDAQTQSATQSQASSDNEVVAYVGDQPITKAELDKQAASKLSQIRQQEYDTRRGVLEKMLQDQLAAKEAKTRGISVDELLKAEIDSKVTAPTTDEVSKFYEENKARMGGRTLDQVQSDVKNYLQQQKATTRKMEFYKDLMAKEHVSVLLDPPRTMVTLNADDPAKGPQTAPVTIVEFSDFQCPFCKRAYGMVDDLVKSYPDKVRLVYRDYPLQFHPQAFPAAEAAHCAGDQGKYWEYANNLMTVEGSLQEDDLKKRAGDLGLNVNDFTTCISGDKHEANIKASFEYGSSLGVTGTPTFFINGRMVVGARPVDELKAMIDEEIDRANRKAGKTQVGG
jgi:protein-disulfide isomerase